MWPPSALRTASFAANRAARDDSSAEDPTPDKSLGPNNRARRAGVRSMARAIRAISTTSTPTAMTTSHPLLDSDGLGEVSWLINVEALGSGEFHAKDVKRDDGEQRLDKGRC